MPEPDKRKEILKAASLSFARFGFSKTTMDDIGRLVGLNKASLYYYYKNKEAIFCEIIEQEGERILAGLSAGISEIPSWEDQIQAYLFERQQYFQKNQNLNNLSQQTAEQLQFQPMFRELAAKFSERETELVYGILKQALDKGVIRDIDLKKTAKVILSLANGLKRDCSHQEGFGPEKVDYAGMAEETRFAVALLLDGLKST